MEETAMEIVTQEKNQAWYKILLSMDKGSVKPMDWRSRTAIRTAISDKLKNDFPLVRFRTEKKTDKNGRIYLEVERIA